MILFTLDNEERHAFRVCLGHLSRRGNFHSWWPDVFFIVNGRRV